MNQILQRLLKTGPSRREVVVTAVAASGALLVGCSPADLLSAGAAKPELGAFGPFIKIAADGAVTVISKHIEFGQGNHAGLAAIVTSLPDDDRRGNRGIVTAQEISVWKTGTSTWK